MIRHEATAQGHGNAKFPRAGLLASSAQRNWRGVLVEHRSHAAGEIPAFTPTSTEVTMLLGSQSGPSARVIRRGNGELQDTSARPGAIWLCPAGVFEDRIRLTDALPSVLHLYVPRDALAVAAEEHGISWSGPAQIRYAAGFADPLIEGIGHALHAELLEESAAGSVLAGALAASLAVRLMTTYAGSRRRIAGGPAALDAVRLNRVVEYIEANLHQPLQLESLASIAALSQFHFLRAFKSATSLAPHQFIVERRLNRARVLLRSTRLSLVDVALDCGFASQASFSRAFLRGTGQTPGRYRSGAG